MQNCVFTNSPENPKHIVTPKHRSRHLCFRFSDLISISTVSDLRLIIQVAGFHALTNHLLNFVLPADSIADRVRNDVFGSQPAKTVNDPSRRQGGESLERFEWIDGSRL